MIKIKRPQIFTSRSDLPKGTRRIDILEGALQELFFVEYPHFKKGDPSAMLQLKRFLEQTDIKGIWIYYPWHQLAIYAPPEDVYFRLRTARNRDLITTGEQLAYRASVVGIAGLSVGSAVVSALVISGGPKKMKIADPDIAEVTNLNRIHAKLFDIGSNKCDIAAREAWEIDPFVDLQVWRQGLHRNNIRRFISGKPRLNIFIDEMDNIELKIMCRMVCRDMHIPVVMATDNGDGVIVDVERYDLEPKRPIFYGQIPEKEVGNMNDDQSLRMAIKIIDPAYFTERHQESILNIGKSLSGVAQLGTSAAMAGAAVAYVVRRIVNKEQLPSGRYIMGCEHIFIPGYNDARQKKHRMERTKEFAQSFGISLRQI